MLAGYSADVEWQQLIFEEYKWMGVSTPVHMLALSFPLLHAATCPHPPKHSSRVVTIKLYEDSMAQNHPREAQPQLINRVLLHRWSLLRPEKGKWDSKSHLGANPHKWKRRRETIRHPFRSKAKCSPLQHNPIHVGRIYWVPSTGRLWTRHHGQNKDKSRRFPSSEGKHFHYHTSLLFTFPPY